MEIVFRRAVMGGVASITGGYKHFGMCPYFIKDEQVESNLIC